jgi:hypothetical protein
MHLRTLHIESKELLFFVLGFQLIKFHEFCLAHNGEPLCDLHLQYTPRKNGPITKNLFHYTIGLATKK